MNRKHDLRKLISALLSGRKLNVDTVAARAGLNFEWISQTLQFNAETIYSGIEYSVIHSPCPLAGG